MLWLIQIVAVVSRLIWKFVPLRPIGRMVIRHRVPFALTVVILMALGVGVGLCKGVSITEQFTFLFDKVLSYLLLIT